MTFDSLMNVLAVSAGPTIAIIVGAVMANRAQRVVQKNAVLAQIATARAAEDAAKAQESASLAATQAANAAHALVDAAQKSNARLDRIAITGEATHKIVNSQHSVLLNLIARLSRRIADENPNDAEATHAARCAEEDAAAAAAAAAPK